MVTPLMMSAKMAAPGLLKTKGFWNKGYHVIRFFHDITKKVLSHDSNYVIDVIMCQSLVTIAFLWEKLSQPQFNRNFTRKIAYFKGWSWFKLNNLGLIPGKNFKFYTGVAKRLKLKVRKFWGIILTFLEVAGEKLVRGKIGWIIYHYLPWISFSLQTSWTEYSLLN